MKIKYIVLNYGNGPWGKLHLIRWSNGQGTLHSTQDMIAKGLCK